MATLSEFVVQTRLTTGSSPLSSFSYPGGMTVFSVDRRPPGLLDPYLFAVKCTGINERRARCTSTIHGAEKPSRRSGASFLFAGAISYWDIFMTDIFAAPPTLSPPPLSASWPYKPRQKKKYYLGYRCPRARRKQEPAGSDYL